MEDQAQATTQTQAPPAPPAEAPATSATALSLETKSALATVHNTADMMSPFSALPAFEAAQRMAKSLAASSLVPEKYQNNIANCLIAMELASRIRISVLAAMQNLDIIHGNPSWRAKFLIGTVNASGQFTKLRYEWQGKPGTDGWGCRAYARDKSDGELCVGPWVTWEVAKKEGWVTRKGSKWMTMPELMFHYRAATFWCRLYCPEISLGFQTTEEVIDTYGEPVVRELPASLRPGDNNSLEGVLGLQRQAAAVVNEEEAGAAESPEAAEATRQAAAADKAEAAVNGKPNSPQQQSLDTKGSK